jgi:protein-S-isoprenylcysteine O-methyltransferase Ste14
MLANAGFTEARFHGWTGYRTSSCTQGGLVTARKPNGEQVPSGNLVASTIAGGKAGTFPKIATLAYGLVCYLLFLAIFLYAIGFVGNLVVPKSIDSGPQVPLAEALALDFLLLALFALQHSVMARPGFKRWWTRLVPVPVERSTYVLVSSLLLGLLFWQWRPIPGVVWDIQQPLALAALWGLFSAGWVIVLVSTLLIDHFDLFGLRQAVFYATGKPYSPPLFRVAAFYRVVRHPIMLGFIVAFWATPVMTWGHFLFALMTTVYIIVAVHLEERDLRDAHGRLYEEYQRRVSMLVPWVGKG